MLLFKNRSFALSVISWDTVELISNTISFKNNLDIPCGDFFKLFLSDPMALSAKEFDCGWYAEVCLCPTFVNKCLAKCPVRVRYHKNWVTKQR